MEYVVQHPAITRSKILGRPLLDRNITHYSNSHQILLVGEGDFSFSSALANAFGSAENMVPTSLDGKEKVLQLYDCESTHKTLSNLERLGATTTMENHHLLGRMRFQRIVYNFPHAGFHGREDNENAQLNEGVIIGAMCFFMLSRKHRQLLKMFFKNARTILRETGEIHVTHKAYWPYKRWELVKQAEECGLRLKESVNFTIADYPGYTNRRGAGSKAGGTFYLGECRTYKFVLGPGVLYHQKLVGVQVALSNISCGASAKDFEAVVTEPEPERKIRSGWDNGPERKMRMGWEMERKMKIGWKREPERQTKKGWEPEQMKMGWEPKPEKKRGMGLHQERMWTGWDREPERKMRVGWEPMGTGWGTVQMGMGWGTEQMKMGWEPKPERKRGMGWHQERMWTGCDSEPERQMRVGWEPMGMDWGTEQMGMSWGTEQMKMGWEPKLERKRVMGWEAEVERQRRMGWEQEEMWTGWDPEPERKTRVPGWEPMGMGWEPEQINMRWEPKTERKRGMGWETEVELQRRMGWEQEQMWTGWDPEPERQMKMGWEKEKMCTNWNSEPERKMRVGWEPLGMGWEAEQMMMGWEAEVERQRRMGWKPMRMGWEQEQMWACWDPERERKTRMPGSEPMGMGWEPELERKIRMVQEPEPWTQIRTGWELEVDRKMRMAGK